MSIYILLTTPMCIELGTITTFIYLATWCSIIYYISNTEGSHRVLKIIAIIAVNAIVLCIHLNNDCHVNYLKTGAATEATLLLLLCHVSGNSLDTPGYSPGSPGSTGDSRTTQTTGNHTTETGSMEKRTGSKKNETTGEN